MKSLIHLPDGTSIKITENEIIPMFGEIETRVGPRTPQEVIGKLRYLAGLNGNIDYNFDIREE